MQNSNPYAQLGAAILEQAIEDYKMAVKYLAKHTSDRRAFNEMLVVQEIEKFFSGASDLYVEEMDTVALFKRFTREHAEIIGKAHESIEIIERRRNDDAKRGNH